MTPSLRERVEQVRRTASRLLRLYGLCWFAVATVAAIVSLGVLDYSLRLHDAAARWLLSILAVGFAGLAFVKLAWPALSLRQGLVAVARRIERCYPQLDERLSSAMAFLAQSEHDPTAGSPDLRRAVVAEAEARSADLDFRAALDVRAARRAAVMAAAALGAAGFVAALNPSAASLSLRRLAMPWREQPWPRRHELAFVQQPVRLAAGDHFEVAVIDRRGTLPDSVQIQLRQETPAGWRTETKEMKPLGGRMVFRLDNVARGFEYRARGGDDDTLPWTELTVVEPSKVIQLTVRVEPPAYTGLSPQSEGRVVKALVGSQLHIRGRLDRPIRWAVARAETPELLLPTVEVAVDGLSFTAPAATLPWLIERSGSFWFELADADGVRSGRDTRIELHAVPDSPPSIAWETPIDHSFVTPRAIVPVKGVVKDDLAIRSIQLRYLRPGSSDEEQIVELYAGPDVGLASSLPVSSGRHNSRPTLSDGESRPLDYGWDLSRLAGLVPGDVLAVRITAEDFKPQLATSIVRRLTIITEEELESRVAMRQGAILGQLAEVLRLARSCREQTSAIAARLQETGQLAAGDIRQLQAAQHNQQQLGRLLGNEPDGVEGQLVALLDELAANRAEKHAMSRRLVELLAGVRELNRRPLPAIEQELTEAIKKAGEEAVAAGRGAVVPCDEAGTSAVVQRLDTAGRAQDEVVQALEKMVGTLGQWDGFSRLAREIGQVRSDEERLAEETEELKLKAVAAAASLAPADRAAAGQLSQRQLDLARRFDKVQTRMEEVLAGLSASDPLAAGTLADALEAARRLAIGGQMREAQQRLSHLQFGQARQAQQVTLSGLNQLLDLLSSRRDYDLARAVASLRQAAADLSGLRRRSAKLQAELDAAAGESSPSAGQRQLERLKAELERLAQEIEQVARRLERLQARRASAALRQAAAKSAAASQAAGGADTKSAQQQTGEAGQQLEGAQQELADAIAQAEAELAHEQLARLEQLVAGLVARETNVLAETQRLEGARDRDGRLESIQQAALRNLAAEQRLVAEETDELRPRLAAAEAFGFALAGAAQHMRRAGGQLARGQTGSAAQEAEQAAVTRLAQILEALRPDQPAAGEASQAPDQQQPMPPSRGDLSGLTAELKLIKLLQQAINRRTTELEAIRAKGGVLSDHQQEEMDALSREQGRLADMVLDLIPTAAQRPEENSDAPENPESKRGENPSGNQDGRAIPDHRTFDGASRPDLEND